jgi:hypothetical protein
MRRSLLWTLLLILAAAPLHAADGLYLTWGDCALGGAGQAVEGFGCDTDAGSHVLICGLTVAAPIDSVLGIEVVVDVQHSAPILPDWWQLLGPGECRDGSLHGDTNFGPLSTCTNFWQTITAGGLLTYTVGMPRGGANQARMVFGFSVPSTQPRALSATDMYYAARIVIDNASTSTCAGCGGAACLVLNSILIRRPLRPEGTPTSDVLVTAPGFGGANWAGWQTMTANCQAVPVRNLTWGAVKAMYR